MCKAVVDHKTTTWALNFLKSVQSITNNNNKKKKKKNVHVQQNSFNRPGEESPAKQQRGLWWLCRSFRDLKLRWKNLVLGKISLFTVCHKKKSQGRCSAQIKPNVNLLSHMPNTEKKTQYISLKAPSPKQSLVRTWKGLESETKVDLPDPTSDLVKPELFSKEVSEGL